VGNPILTARSLRSACKEMRRTSTPIADLIPLLQLAADQIDMLVATVKAALKDELKELPPFYDSPNHIGEIGVGPIENCPCISCAGIPQLQA